MKQVKRRWSIVSIIVNTPPIDLEGEHVLFDYLQTHAQHIVNYAKAELDGVREDFNLNIECTSIARE